MGEFDPVAYFLPGWQDEMEQYCTNIDEIVTSAVELGTSCDSCPVWQVIIPGGGHWIQQEKAAEVTEKLLGFFKNQDLAKLVSS